MSIVCPRKHTNWISWIIMSTNLGQISHSLCKVSVTASILPKMLMPYSFRQRTEYISTLTVQIELLFPSAETVIFWPDIVWVAEFPYGFHPSKILTLRWKKTRPTWLQFCQPIDESGRKLGHVANFRFLIQGLPLSTFILWSLFQKP